MTIRKIVEEVFESIDANGIVEIDKRGVHI